MLNLTGARNGYIVGEAELRIKFSYDASAFALDLYQLSTDSVKVNGEYADFSFNDNLIRINHQVNASDTFLVTIFYQGQPTTDSRWGGFFSDGTLAYNIGVGMGSQPHGIGRFWYPCIDSFTDRATYEYLLKTNKSDKAVACGTLLNTVEDIDNTIYHWQLNESIPTYLNSFAVGPFVEIKDTYNGIEKNIPIEIYVLKQDSSATIQAFSKLKETLAVFETKFGPYFWPRVGYVVVPFSSGAMEHATNIAYPSGNLGANTGAYNLVAHELAHHWFGNLVTCSTSSDMWLNEGWASYCETIFKEGVLGTEIGKNHTLNNHINVIKTAHKADNGYFALNNLGHEITYGSHAYDKGALVTHCLRGYLGDEKFFSSVAKFLKQNKYTHISSAYLQTELSSITGVDLEPFFDNWVYQPGFPHYSVGSFTAVANGNAYDVTVQIKQKIKARENFSTKNRVELSFIDTNFNQIDTIISFDSEIETLQFTLPIKPVAVFTDINNWVLDPITTDMHSITEPGYTTFTNCEFKLKTTSIADSALIRVQYNWLQADDFKKPLDGLTMSNYHYWKVEGVFPEGFRAEGKFSYNFTQNTNAEESYTQGANDTVVLVYRKDMNSEWEAIKKIESARIVTSYTWIENLRVGEYALAYWDGSSPIGMEKKINGTFEPYIYPNPFSSSFSIKMPEYFSGTIEIVDLLGKRIDKQELRNAGEINLSTDNIPNGVFLVNTIGNISTSLIGVKK